MAYRITLTDKEYETLCWLSDRGYDAELLDLATLESTPEDELPEAPNVYVLVMSEPTAWTWNENIEADRHAYLTCLGPGDLMDKLIALEQSIV